MLTADPGFYKIPTAPKPVAAPVYKPYVPTNPGWGGATQANDMSKYGYDVPGTPAAPSIPYSDPSGGGDGSGGVAWQPPVAAAIPTPFKPTYDFSGIENSWNARMGNARSKYGMDLKQRIIDLGLGDWSKLSKDSQGYLDEATRQSALDNKFSLYRLAEDRFKIGSANSRAQLAARGILGSGQTAKTAQDLLNQQEQTKYMDTRQALGDINNWSQGLAELETQRQQELANARLQAASAGYA